MKAVGLTLMVLLVPLLAIVTFGGQGVSYEAPAHQGRSNQSTATARELGSPKNVMEEAFDAESGTLTLLAAGDIADCPLPGGLANAVSKTADRLGLPPAFDLVPAYRTADLAESWPEAPILALGDLVYQSGTPAEFADCYDPIWGDLRVRTLPTPGNHEYRSPEAFGYYDYWTLRAGPDRRGYYSVAVGNWLLLSLNSEVEAGPQTDQGRWLEAVLDTAPQTCVLAFYHKPAFSLQERDGRQNAVQLFQQLQQHGATLVLNGHNHFYERTAPLAADGTVDTSNGTIAFTVGTGGRTSGEKVILESTEAAVFGTIGLLRLELADHGVRWWYHNARTGEVADDGNVECNPARTGTQ